MSKVWISYVQNLESWCDWPVVVDHATVKQFHSKFLIWKIPFLKLFFFISYFSLIPLLLSSSIYLNRSYGTKFEMNFLIRRTFRNHFVHFTIVYAIAKA